MWDIPRTIVASDKLEELESLKTFNMNMQYSDDGGSGFTYPAMTPKLMENYDIVQFVIAH